jgi:ABC-2 type transport system permease protein
MSLWTRARDHVQLHLEGVRLGIAVRVSDRLDFLASLLVMMGIELLPTLVTALLYGNGRHFPDWTLREAVLVQGVFLVAKGIAYPLFGGMVWNTANMVREGTFELLLLLPRHPLQSCVVRAFDAEDIGKLVGGLALTSWCMSGMDMPAIVPLVGFGLLLALAILVLLASAIAMASLLIVWVGNFRVYEIFEGLASLGQFPPTILPRKVRSLGVAGFPFAALAVLPTSALLGKPLDGVWMAVLSTVVLLILALGLWNMLLRRLVGAGG